MRIEWTGIYYDGKTAARNKVSVTLTPESIILKKEDGARLEWAYAGINRFNGEYDGGPVRMFRGSEELVITESDFLKSLRQTAPLHSSKFQDPDSVNKRKLWIPLAAFFIVAAFSSIYFFLIPGTAGFLAGVIPTAWEEKLGEAVLTEFIKDMPECNAAMNKPMNEILSQLDKAAQPHPYKFRIHVVENGAVNAFALPGGHLVIFSGLLDITERPEEVAGVLAHEMEHVLMRHTTKGIFQELSTKMLFSVVTGDIYGAANAVNTLGSLRFSRLNEEEADLKGQGLLMKANINPAGMLDFFARMNDLDGEMPKRLTYLSTHPVPDDRIAYLYKNIKSPHTGPVLLPDVDWQEFRSSCGDYK